jgi:hypothetical protein
MTRRRPGRERGQALVEFAFILPVTLVLLIALVDIGRVVWASDAVANAAAEAARFAAVHGGSPGQACPVGPANETVAIPNPNTCGYPVSPSKAAIVTRAKARALSAGGTLTVNVCYFRKGDTPCSGDTDTTTNAPGARVKVAVTAQLGLVATSLLGGRTWDVTAQSTLVIDY